MQTPPRISVVIPAHDCAATLPRAVASVAASAAHAREIMGIPLRTEVVVVNDASTDATAAAIAALDAQTGGRAPPPHLQVRRVSRQPRRGTGAQRRGAPLRRAVHRLPRRRRRVPAAAPRGVPQRPAHRPRHRLRVDKATPRRAGAPHLGPLARPQHGDEPLPAPHLARNRQGLSRTPGFRPHGHRGQLLPHRPGRPHRRPRPAGRNRADPPLAGKLARPPEGKTRHPRSTGGTPPGKPSSRAKPSSPPSTNASPTSNA